jgi:hypothetical protein
MKTIIHFKSFLLFIIIISTSTSCETYNIKPSINKQDFINKLANNKLNYFITPLTPNFRTERNLLIKNINKLFLAKTNEISNIPNTGLF